MMTMMLLMMLYLPYPILPFFPLKMIAKFCLWLNLRLIPMWAVTAGENFSPSTLTLCRMVALPALPFLELDCYTVG